MKGSPAEKPYAPRTTASVHSQSVDTPSGGEGRGRDNARNVDGRKRHIVVDSLGVLLAGPGAAAGRAGAPGAAGPFPPPGRPPMSPGPAIGAGNKYPNFPVYRSGARDPG